MATGRPSDFTQQLADHICGLISDGRSLRSILRDDDTMPAMSTIFKWLREHQSFSEQYTRAKEEQADALAEDMQDIADNPTGDVQRDRLRVDTRKWIASKLKPKKYGDKVDATIEHSGQVGVVFQTVYESAKKSEDDG
jgi:Bacteriophage Sf6, terminase small subunit-like